MTTVAELAEQVRQVEGYPIVILATQDFDLGDVQYQHPLQYDSYPGDLAAKLTKLCNREVHVLVITANGDQLSSQEPHRGSDWRLDYVREGWTDSKRLRELLKKFGVAYTEELNEGRLSVQISADFQRSEIVNGVPGYGAIFGFELNTGQFKDAWLGYVD